MRVIVGGGRDYEDESHVGSVLDWIHQDYGITTLIEGGAKGADFLARCWVGRQHDLIELLTFKADWDNITAPGAKIGYHNNGYSNNQKPYNILAGIWRNEKMITEGFGQMLISFPGDKGTRDMVERAIKHRLPVFMAHSLFGELAKEQLGYWHPDAGSRPTKNLRAIATPKDRYEAIF